MQEKHFGDPWTCSTGAGLLERKQGAAPSPSASSTTRGSAPSSVEEVQPPAESPQPRLSGQEAGTQRCRTSVCHSPTGRSSAEAAFGPTLLLQRGSTGSSEGCDGPSPYPIPSFPQARLLPFWVPSRLLLHMPQQRNFSLTGPPLLGSGGTASCPLGGLENQSFLPPGD